MSYRVAISQAQQPTTPTNSTVKPQASGDNIEMAYTKTHCRTGSNFSQGSQGGQGQRYRQAGHARTGSNFSARQMKGHVRAGSNFSQASRHTAASIETQPMPMGASYCHFWSAEYDDFGKETDYRSLCCCGLMHVTTGAKVIGWIQLLTFAFYFLFPVGTALLGNFMLALGADKTNIEVTNTERDTVDQISMVDQFPVEVENYTLTANGKVINVDDYDDDMLVGTGNDYEDAYFFNLDKTTMTVIAIIAGVLILLLLLPVVLMLIGVSYQRRMLLLPYLFVTFICVVIGGFCFNPLAILYLWFVYVVFRCYRYLRWCDHHPEYFMEPGQQGDEASLHSLEGGGCRQSDDSQGTCKPAECHKCSAPLGPAAATDNSGDAAANSDSAAAFNSEKQTLLPANNNNSSSGGTPIGQQPAPQPKMSKDLTENLSNGSRSPTKVAHV